MATEVHAEDVLVLCQIGRHALEEGCFLALKEARADEKERLWPRLGIKIKRDPGAVPGRCLEGLPLHAYNCISQLLSLSRGITTEASKTCSEERGWTFSYPLPDPKILVVFGIQPSEVILREPLVESDPVDGQFPSDDLQRLPGREITRVRDKVAA